MCRLTQDAHSRNRGLIVPSWSNGTIPERATINVRSSSPAGRFTFSPPCLTSTTPELTGTPHITAPILILLRVGLPADTHLRREAAKLLVIVELQTQVGFPMAMVCCRHLSTKARRLRRDRGHYPSHLPRPLGVYPSSDLSTPLHPTWAMAQSHTGAKAMTPRSGSQRRSE